MREIRTWGSVRGVPSDWHPYRDLRRDATRAPIQGPERHGVGLQSRPQNSTPRPRRTLAYCGEKMVLTMGSTIKNVLT